MPEKHISEHPAEYHGRLQLVEDGMERSGDILRKLDGYA